MRGSIARCQTKPHISGVDRIPAETAEVLQSFFTSKKGFGRFKPAGYPNGWPDGVFNEKN